MFKEGDKVRIRSNGAAGIVAYAEDGYYSVELSNGAEMDFENSDLLMTEDEFQEQLEASKPAAPKGDTPKFLAAPYVPRKGDRRLASTVIGMIRKIYPGLFDAMKFRNKGFDKLDAFDQVKHISEMSGTPMIVFMGAGEATAEMMRQVIGITLLNNILEGTDLTVDILLGTAQRVFDEYEAGEK